jgi:hypothetical protein
MQQLWGYRVEEKLHLGVWVQKTLSATALGYFPKSSEDVPGKAQAFLFLFYHVLSRR